MTITTTTQLFTAINAIDKASLSLIEINELANQFNGNVSPTIDHPTIEVNSKLGYLNFNRTNSGYQLNHVKFHQGPIVGSNIIMKMDSPNSDWKKGDTGIITQYDENGQFWASFNNAKPCPIQNDTDFHTTASKYDNLKINDSAAAIIRTNRNESIKDDINQHIETFRAKLNQHETLEISQWFGLTLYFIVLDERKEYPHNHRLIISYDTSTGFFYHGDHKHLITRHGWATFVNELLDNNHKRPIAA